MIDIGITSEECHVVDTNLIVGICVLIQTLGNILYFRSLIGAARVNGNQIGNQPAVFQRIVGIGTMDEEGAAAYTCQVPDTGYVIGNCPVFTVFGHAGLILQIPFVLHIDRSKAERTGRIFCFLSARHHIIDAHPLKVHLGLCHCIVNATVADSDCNPFAHVFFHIKTVWSGKIGIAYRRCRECGLRNQFFPFTVFLKLLYKQRVSFEIILV